jgi:hypothetical protein
MAPAAAQLHLGAALSGIQIMHMVPTWVFTAESLTTSVQPGWCAACYACGVRGMHCTLASVQCSLADADAPLVLMIALCTSPHASLCVTLFFYLSVLLLSGASLWCWWREVRITHLLSVLSISVLTAHCTNFGSNMAYAAVLSWHSGCGVSTFNNRPKHHACT